MASYWHLSQKHLNTLETCPPLFQKLYLQQLKSPFNLIQEEKTQWGKQFHLLMQQHNLGLFIDDIQTENDDLKVSVKALVNATENIWKSSDIIARKAEYQVNYTIKNYLFTSVYDLLILSENKAVIFDWKTYLKPQNEQILINNWQTKLYLYILAEKFPYKPSQISFTYWFVKLPNEPQKYTITYNKIKHEKTRKELNYLLKKLEHLTTEYIENKVNFSHHNNCETCPHRYHFPNLLTESKLHQNLPTSLDDI
ncbi:PD-(D/E)XK nuclease family protein [Geminocystis sp. GBBB08]|uniref:PD-(D/E)XK nuclease family protein n=1 Tax=Geminocystis sp. GBBB08 TaxID=2604140 RepID=UPI0027E343CF|nr:PD-(D/E)XK nuclease family protein [Geminocystis sp. GBBB08]MBL1210703.1 PD-(D/E)XK nuclease family protein [Geminocystis sp. GBBB08]